MVKQRKQTKNNNSENVLKEYYERNEYYWRESTEEQRKKKEKKKNKYKYKDGKKSLLKPIRLCRLYLFIAKYNILWLWIKKRASQFTETKAVNMYEWLKWCTILFFIYT